MEKIKGIFIDVQHETAQVVTVDKSIEQYHRMVNGFFDIANRKIGGKYYDIICDDEGLFKVKPKISAIDDLGRAMLVGNLFIVKFDGKENETSLDDEDINHIMKYIMPQGTRNYPRPYPMLHQVDY